jgi:hypothetical protein
MLAAACATMRVSVEEGPEAEQASAWYETYAWLPTPRRDESHGNPLVEANLKQTVDRGLAAKDFRRVSPSDHPDFLVGWHATTRERTQVEEINPYWGYHWSPVFGPPPSYGGAARGPGGATAAEYERGTVILDIIDARSNELVWRGTVKAHLGANPSARDTEKKVSNAVDKILAQFPPGA